MKLSTTIQFLHRFYGSIIRERKGHVKSRDDCSDEASDAATDEYINKLESRSTSMFFIYISVFISRFNSVANAQTTAHLLECVKDQVCNHPNK